MARDAGLVEPSDSDLEEDPASREELAEAFASAEPITFFGTDFDVHGLVRRLEQGDVIVPNFDPLGNGEMDLEGFQRAFVWRKYQMDRFIESLLLGYPVPGIFLVQQEDRRLLVLDGQQRLRTLQRFFDGKLEDGETFALENVSASLVGQTYETLDPELRRALDNSFIHATVIKYDPQVGGDESIYQLFERLNASGSNLYPHEIRVALYPGTLVRFIADLNSYSAWRTVYGKPSPRLKDHEQILRFIALYTEASSYSRPLKGFLNGFVKRHRNMEGLDEDQLRFIFYRVCDALADGPGNRSFRAPRVINAAFADSVMVGLARRCDSGPIKNPGEIEPMLSKLLRDKDFEAAIARATADEDRVAYRLKAATDLFASIL